MTAADTEKSGRLLPLEADLHASEARLERAHDVIIERQVRRRALVGSRPDLTVIRWLDDRRAERDRPGVGGPAIDG